MRPRSSESGLLAAWLPSAVAVTMAACFTYGGVQLDLRAVANDPQVQMAHDGAALLATGLPATSVVPPGGQLDAATSLSPFVAVYADDLTVIGSSTALDGRTPTPPAGVFAYARAKGEDRVTWQPKDGVRLATVVVPWSGGGKSGFVLVARSLRETEDREDRLLLLVVVGWIASLIATFAAAMAPVLLRKR